MNRLRTARYKENPTWGWPETAAMLLWCAAAGFAIRQHVPWADEAQAWLLAADNSWKTLFVHSLRYEGSGGLWHAFLKLLQTMHLPFKAMRWIAAGVQGAAMAVLLAYAPFPRFLRLLLPFTFFLLYQDAVIARSYCLLAILAFPAAMLLRRQQPRPWILAILLGLMANLSVHGLLLSGGLAFVAARWWGSRFVRNVPALAILLLFWLAALATMAPAPDVSYAAGNNIERSIGKVERSLGMHPAAPPPVISQSMNGLPPPPVHPHVRHGLAKLRNRAARVLGVLTFPLSQSRVLALLLVGLLCFQAWTTGRAVGLLPYALMALVFCSLYLAPRHAGTLLTGFVVSAWLTWPETIPPPRPLRRWPWVQPATVALFTLVCAEQIGWSIHTIAAERRLPYAPDAATAAYLKEKGVGRLPGPRVAGFGYFSIGPLLYFPRNIYFNQAPHRYWFWSSAEPSATVWDALAQQPSFIVVGTFESGPQGEITRDWEPAELADPSILLGDSYGFVRFFEAHGFHQTHVFCGRSWMRSSYAEQMCDMILEPVHTP